MSFVPFMVLILIVDIILRGVALWKSAQNKQKYWFVALLVVNTAGILPVIYLIWFSKKSRK